MNSLNNQNSDGTNRKPSIINIIIIGFLISVAFNFITSMFIGNKNTQISYNQFLSFVENGCVQQVTLQDDIIMLQLKKDYDKAIAREILRLEDNDRTARALNNLSICYTGNVSYPEFTNILLKNNVDFAKVIPVNSPILDFILQWILPFLFISIILNFFMKRAQGAMGSITKIGKSSAKMYNLEKQTGVTFKDIAGQDEAKESLLEISDCLKNPEKYKKIGAKQPKGALLVGPPGTGKTLLAKAVAGEAGVPFFSLSGSEFIEMFVGVGASRVRDLFEQAKETAPCIIFIDEIDAIGKNRDNQLSNNDEREQTLNQLLAEMDGFESGQSIVVLAATNRPETLDKALLRPGRFDRRIIVEKPDLAGREAILRVHAAKVAVGSDVDLRQIAYATSGASGADLANMINEAALRAVRLGRNEMLQEDIMDAVEVVIAGKEKKDRILSSTEKRIVSYHEVGHALAAALQNNLQPVQKITIVPHTMGALGYTLQMPEDEKFLWSRDELLAQVVTLLAGRAAEKLVFNTQTTGASNDIERATQIARNMVTQYGMSDKFGMMGLESVENRYLDGRKAMTCSEATGEAIDAEVRDIIKDCYDKAVELLSNNSNALERIAEYLCTKETITGTEFMEMLSHNRHLG